jgi:hypothetical protein
MNKFIFNPALKYGICDFDNGIGDAVIKSSIPENFYLNFGAKLFDLEKKWIFDFNPYIERGGGVDVVLRILTDQISIINSDFRIEHRSDGAEYCWNYNMPKCYLRHPRFYIYENVHTKKDQVVIHTTGKTVGSLNNDVIKIIEKNYSDYNLIQIGGISDIKVPSAYDARGFDLWQSIALIAESAIFIGVNSGFYHCARAYPKVRKKIILNSDINWLKTMRPMNIHMNSEWLDYNVEFFNMSTYDCGVTNSIFKI